MIERTPIVDNKEDFESMVNRIQQGSVVTFREYTLNRHEKRVLSVSIENSVVQDVIPANTRLSIEQLTELYGEDLEPEDYLQLSTSTYPRIVLGLGLNEYNEMNIKIITLVKYYYDTRLQELEIVSDSSPQDEPNYLDFIQKGLMF